MKTTFKKQIWLFLLSLWLLPNAWSQQSELRLMVYNLTNYGNVIGGCTSANNGVSLKNPELKTIFQYAEPDILGVCEMNTNAILADNLLNNTLNTDGKNWYRRSTQIAEPSGTITTLIYYDSRKFTLQREFAIQTSYRVTRHFRLYANTAGLSQGDTTWLNILTCHLKAGNTSADQTDRGTMASVIKNYLNNLSRKENCVIMGDFNVYRSSEVAFQTLTSAGTNPTYQFFDPVNRVGSWTVNASFADVHTQCPRTDTNGGCFSGGGLDDRFDFILMNRHLLNDSAGLRYKPQSYRALGNDGQHYNKNITDSPPNTSVPLNVLSSLFKVSDHLPVVADLVLNQPLTASASARTWPELQLSLSSEKLFWNTSEDETVFIQAFATDGKMLYQEKTNASLKEWALPASLESKKPILIRLHFERSSKVGQIWKVK